MNWGAAGPTLVPVRQSQGDCGTAKRGKDVLRVCLSDRPWGVQREAERDLETGQVIRTTRWS